MCVILHMARSPQSAQLLRIIGSDKLDRQRVSLDSVDTFESASNFSHGCQSM